MADPRALVRLPLDFSKGLRNDLEPSTTPNGFVTRLDNWRPAGEGLRIRQGWLHSAAPAPPMTDVIGIHRQEASNSIILISPTGTGISAHWINEPEDSWAAAGVPATDDTPLLVSMAMGDVILSMVWGGWAKIYGIDAGPTLIDSGAHVVPQFCNAIEYHNSMWWTGGGYDSTPTYHPTRLFFQDPGVSSVTHDWPVDNWIDVGSAGIIKCLRSHRGNLLIGLDSGLWLLQGTPDDQPDLQQLDQGEAVNGDSIVSTPFGAVICGRYGVYLFDGSSVQIISRPIQDTYSPELIADAVYQDGSVYICCGGTDTMHVFDLEATAWSMERFPSAAEAPYRLYGCIDANDPARRFLLGGTNGATAGKGLVYRGQDVPVSYAPDFAGWDEEFTLRTPEYWVTGPEAPVGFRTLDLRLRQRTGTPASSGLSVTPTIRGTDGSSTTLPATIIRPGNPGDVIRASVPIPKQTGYGARFLVEQSSAGALFDIEEAVLTYQPTGPRSG